LLKKDGHNDWSYRIAGSGEYLQKLEELVKEYHLEEHVSFLGKIDDEKLKLEYSKTDIFILCSREDWKTPNIEGFGIVFLEAASCGIPSISRQERRNT
jgi:phosphatidylinositol alpha-1,6-mannosyltransferase